MTKNEFFESLDKTDLSKQEKINVCQFYIDNFPIIINDPFKGKIETKLELIITGGSDIIINYAFNKLVERKKELTTLIS